jgi:hypothetical protein
MQGTGARIADFIDARGNRRLDILATPGPRIPFPFTPCRDHYCPFAALKAAINLMKFAVRQRPFLLQSERFTTKIGSKTRHRIEHIADVRFSHR